MEIVDRVQRRRVAAVGIAQRVHHAPRSYRDADRTVLVRVHEEGGHRIRGIGARHGGEGARSQGPGQGPEVFEPERWPHRLAERDQEVDLVVLGRVVAHELDSGRRARVVDGHRVRRARPEGVLGNVLHVRQELDAQRKVAVAGDPVHVYRVALWAAVDVDAGVGERAARYNVEVAQGVEVPDVFVELDREADRVAIGGAGRDGGDRGVGGGRIVGRDHDVIQKEGAAIREQHVPEPPQDNVPGPIDHDRGHLIRRGPAARLLPNRDRIAFHEQLHAHRVARRRGPVIEGHGADPVGVAVPVQP